MENRDWYQKREGQAEHLVYLDNEGKELEKFAGLLARRVRWGDVRKRTISYTLLKRAGKWKSLIVVC